MNGSDKKKLETTFLIKNHDRKSFELKNKIFPFVTRQRRPRAPRGHVSNAPVCSSTKIN